MPKDWQVFPGEDSPMIFCPHPDGSNTLQQVADQQARWRVSAYSAVLAWYFSPQVRQDRQQSTMPCPSFNEILGAMSSLGAFSMVPTPVLPPNGEDISHRSMGLPWTVGQADVFFRPVRPSWPPFPPCPSSSCPSGAVGDFLGRSGGAISSLLGRTLLPASPGNALNGVSALRSRFRGSQPS